LIECSYESVTSLLLLVPFLIDQAEQVAVESVELTLLVQFLKLGFNLAKLLVDNGRADDLVGRASRLEDLFLFGLLAHQKQSMVLQEEAVLT